MDGLAAWARGRGLSVLLKPNMVEYDPASVINTDPRLVAATVAVMKRLGARSVTVAEGPGHRRDTQYVVERSGLRDLLRDVDAPFVDLNAAALRRVQLQTGWTSFGELWLPTEVLDADLVVSMPKMKTHHWGGVTLSLKNMFGVVPGRIYGWPKNVLHWAGLQESILDVAAAVRPGLAIVDGIVGMQGDGPIKGDPMPAGHVVFGTDPVAVDATAAMLMGVDPDRVSYLAEAGRFLGQANLERITQLAEDRRTPGHPVCPAAGVRRAFDPAPPPGPSAPSPRTQQAAEFASAPAHQRAVADEEDRLVVPVGLAPAGVLCRALGDGHVGREEHGLHAVPVHEGDPVVRRATDGRVVVEDLLRVHVVAAVHEDAAARVVDPRDHVAAPAVLRQDPGVRLDAQQGGDGIGRIGLVLLGDHVQRDWWAG